MIGQAVRTRMVVVVGRRPGADAGGWVARAAERGLSLLVLTVGYPVSEPQQAFVSAAVDRAFEVRLPLEAAFVQDLDGLPRLLDAGDDVSVLATGREQRRLERSLKA